MSQTEDLSFSTVRLECKLNSGSISTGTGFFYRFLDNGETYLPVIITNKHVIKDSLKGSFLFTQADDNNSPIYGKHFFAEFEDFEAQWVMHPDHEVDLCAIGIGNIVKYAESKGVKLYYRTFGNELLPSEEQIENLHVVEDILMVGYPNGIWDKANNQPIFRKGTTATHIKLDYNGKKDFMIDAACFPGSSGSPVLIYNQSGYSTKTGAFHMGTNRIHLIGILYAGPQHTTVGEVQIVNIPTKQSAVSLSGIPNNLGICIKAEKILDLEAEFKKMQ